MTELRVDPLTGLRVVVAPERGTRPGALPAIPDRQPVDAAADPFAPGNEDATPPELARRPDAAAGGWSARAVPNRWPVLAPDAAAPARDAQPDLFHADAALGAHEVLVNAPEPVAALSALPDGRLAEAMELWRERIAAHARADAACVHLFVNEGPTAGSSLPHSHAQLLALPFVPAALARERERFGAYATRTMGGDLLGDLVQTEVRRRERIVAIDEEAVLLCPWASRVPFQLMLVPRRPRPRFEDDGPLGAALLGDGLRRLARALGGPPPLNLWVRTAPRGADRFCWRIDVLPRLAQPGGLELGTGLQVCVVAPEDAAARLREA